jgi:hypothetical protein
VEPGCELADRLGLPHHLQHQLSACFGKDGKHALLIFKRQGHLASEGSPIICALSGSFGSREKPSDILSPNNNFGHGIHLFIWVTTSYHSRWKRSTVVS